MLTLVTASPGGGKSQYVIERFILDLIRDNEAAIAAWKEPTEEQPVPPVRRHVFANINGLDVGAIHALVGGHVVQPSPLDWRTCPDGSVVIYDEAQQDHLFRASGKPGAPMVPNPDYVRGNGQPEQIEDERMTRLDTHRHRGFDIVMVTQDQGLVHHWAKKFVGCHLHLNRPSGAELITVYEWSKVQASPDDYFAKRDADCHTRRMNPATWKLYKSATIHTHKFSMPKGAKYAIRTFLALALLIPLGFGSLAVWGGREIPEPSPEIMDTLKPLLPQEAAPPPAASGQFAWSAAGRVAPINGCAAGRHCRCWDFDGQVIDMDEGTCRNLAEGIIPMPIDLNRFMTSGAAVGEGAGGGAAPAPPAPSASLVGVSTAPTSLGSTAQGDVQGNSPSTLSSSGG